MRGTTIIGFSNSLKDSSTQTPSYPGMDLDWDRPSGPGCLDPEQQQEEVTRFVIETNNVMVQVGPR